MGTGDPDFVGEREEGRGREWEEEWCFVDVVSPGLGSGDVWTPGSFGDAGLCWTDSRRGSHESTPGGRPPASRVRVLWMTGFHVGAREMCCDVMGIGSGKEGDDRSSFIFHRAWLID